MARRSLVGRRVDRAVKMAYTNAKAKVPMDTGTLRNSLTLHQSPNGFNVSFRTGNINPKSKKPVKAYIDYVERYHENWWDTTVETFFAELEKQTDCKVKKK